MPLAGAFCAGETLADVLEAALRGDDPWTALPWRIVTDVLDVAALELRHPVGVLVLVEADDTPRYGLELFLQWISMRGSNGANAPSVTRSLLCSASLTVWRHWIRALLGVSEAPSVSSELVDDIRCVPVAGGARRLLR